MPSRITECPLPQLALQHGAETCDMAVIGHEGLLWRGTTFRSVGRVRT